MPSTAAKVLRKLDEAGLLGHQLFLVGTHSLYAYEAKAGVRFETDLTATADLDLLVDARQHMSLAVAEDVKPEGILGLLRKADRTFARTDEFRATNDDGYYVDLIAPLPPNEASETAIRLGDTNDDLAAAAILGLQWLINAPKFEEVVIGADGLPLWVSCIDPRAFALHKFWVSRGIERDRKCHCWRASWHGGGLAHRAPQVLERLGAFCSTHSPQSPGASLSSHKPVSSRKAGDCRISRVRSRSPARQARSAAVFLFEFAG